MNEILKDLEKLGKEIDEAKKNVAQYEGQKFQLMKQLEELGFKTIEEAQKNILLLSKEEEKLTKEIESDYKELKEQYQW